MCVWKMKEVYLDNAATTKLDKNVLKEMMPHLTNDYGNPSSMHNKGIVAKNAISESRAKVAKILNCKAEEIIFVGSGTESDNLAILGFVKKNKNKGKHLITTQIEHPAILNVFKRLEELGFKVTYLDVNREGLVDLEQLEKAITKDTILVSIIYVNNEIGVVQDVEKIAKICKKNKVVFHTDACQAGPYLSLDVKKLGVDMMTLNGSKIYGPKGVGILFKKNYIELEPLIYGGGQENNLRSGTENVANIVGFTKALFLVDKRKKKEVVRLTKLRDYMIKELLKIDESWLNGHKTKRLPNNVNVSFINVEGESFVLLLNEKGVYASTGSACSSHKLAASHVILALGLISEFAHSSIRFTLGKDTTKEDVDYVLREVKEIVDTLRHISPLKDTVEKLFVRSKLNGRFK